MMMMKSMLLVDEIANVVNLNDCPLDNVEFQRDCKEKLDSDGALCLPNFLTEDALASILRDGLEKENCAFFPPNQSHNIYLLPNDPMYPSHHVRNRLVTSSKGCIQHDLIPSHSKLHTLYNSPAFRAFLCAVLNEPELHRYQDNLSSINIHYAKHGQELGWHYDNSSFAITLLIQKPNQGGTFEFVQNVRNANNDEKDISMTMNFDLSERILNGQVETKTLQMEPGTLVLFRGRNSLHRVTPVVGSKMRILVGFAYNSEPGISLSESARMTFFGRLG